MTKIVLVCLFHLIGLALSQLSYNSCRQCGRITSVQSRIKRDVKAESPIFNFNLNIRLELDIASNATSSTSRPTTRSTSTLPTSSVDGEREEDDDSLGRDVPWQAFVVHQSSTHFCPAIFINKAYLLASQSCLKAFEEQLMKDAMLYPTFPSSPIRQMLSNKETIPRISQVIHHDGFLILENGEMINDLSLIKAKVSKDWPVVPLCLPPRRSAKKTNQSGSSTLALVQFFWPMNLTSASSPVVVMSSIKARNDSLCQTRISAGQKNGDHRLCITFNSEVDCMGGSYTGGSVTSYNTLSRRHSLVGLFSYGQSICGETGRHKENTVMIFTKVDQYLRWIASKIQDGECNVL